MKARLLTATLVIAAACVGAPVQAENPASQVLCGERSAILETLRQRYAEKPEAMGLAGNGNVVELLTSGTGSWTILVTRPSGLTCLAAAGSFWEDVETPKAGLPM